MGGLLFLPFVEVVEKNQCIREVPSFTIKNSEGANNVYESLPMIDDLSGLKIKFLT